MTSLRPLLLLSVLAGPLTAAGADGLVLRADFDGDGDEDSLVSARIDAFGNGGAPWRLTLAGPTPRRHALAGGRVWSLERGDGWFRLWTYWHLSARSGSLIAYTVTADGAMVAQEITIAPGDSGTELGNALYAAAFAPDRRLAFGFGEPYVSEADR